MSISIVKSIENFLHGLVTDVDTTIEPSIAYLKANVPAIAIQLGEELLAGALAGSPWATLLETLTAQVEAQGIKLAEGAAKVALNTAESNLIAKAALAPTAA